MSVSENFRRFFNFNSPATIVHDQLQAAGLFFVRGQCDFARVLLRFGNRVECVQQKIDHRLLYLNPIGEDRAQCMAHIDLKRHAADHRIATDDSADLRQ